MRCLPQREHCTTMEESNESQIFSLCCLRLLMADRKKSRPSEELVPISPSCVRVRLCLPGARLVLDQINRWVRDKLLLAVNRCGVEPSIDTLKEPKFGPTAL